MPDPIPKPETQPEKCLAAIRECDEAIDSLWELVMLLREGDTPKEATIPPEEDTSFIGVWKHVPGELCRLSSCIQSIEHTLRRLVLYADAEDEPDRAQKQKAAKDA